MLGIFKWFKSGTRMKRWMFVIIIGIILLCFGIATIIDMKELSILNLILTIAISIMGFIMVIVGIIYSQKRVLELLIEDTDDRITDNKKDVNVNSLIFNKTVYKEGPKIVVIGGGTGLNTVLKGMKDYTNNLTAIVEMSDYGDKKKELKESKSILPIKDVKDSIIALSSNKEEMKKLLDLHVQSGMDFTDLFVSAMQEINGEGSKFIENISKVLNISGRILPVTLDNMNICAELEDGTLIEDKNKIGETSIDKISRINRVFVAPSNARPAQGVLEAITDADAIIIGPGNLFTDVIPNLLIKNISRTIEESKAIKIYIGNIMTKPGETDDFALSDHIKAIFEHANHKVIDYCIYDTGEVVPEFVRRYNKDGADLVEQDISVCRELGIKLVPKNFSCIENEAIRHDPISVADSIIELICEDLKFKDMQNNPKYVRMNSKLKAHNEVRKEKEKIKNKAKKQENKANKKARRLDDRKKSKFSSKYNERIKSIKTSEEIREENRRMFEEDEED
ncbi:MAG: uridine diphosphate-N-acetylglucosamine-binding protein YvcK [Clostridia bacterium]|nr:uridine diphosphate-N-acetylglucosamine-binding protein YvcK [Clostridia bacterium]